MRSFKFASLVLSGALALGASGCAHNDAGATANANSAATASSQPGSPADVEKEDGSTVSVATESDGSKREERSFKSGEVARVSRVTRPNGTRTATVEMRDGRSAELKGEGEVEKALEASSEWLTDAANRTWDTTKDVAGKSADTGKDVGKKVGTGIKRGAEEVADKTKDAAGAVKKGTKKIVDKVKN